VGCGKLPSGCGKRSLGDYGTNDLLEVDNKLVQYHLRNDSVERKEMLGLGGH